MALLVGQKTAALSFSVTMASDQGSIGDMNLQVGDVDLLADPLGNALVTISFPHHKIHLGITFNASFKILTLANAASLDILLVTGANKEAHLTARFVCGGDAEILIYEDTTTQAPLNDGTALAEVNLHRGSAVVSTLVATHTPTINALGTLLIDGAIGGGTGGNAAGGTIRVGTERILARSKKYLFRLTNRSGGVKIGSIVLEWYEADPIP